jgi:dihydroorotase
MPPVTTMEYDLLLAGGRVIDPRAGIDGVTDVAVKDGRIAAVARNLPRDAAREVVDLRGRLVLPGLIDTHAHVYEHVSGRFGLNADLCGVHSGVTALVDQGGPSNMTFPGFREFIAKRAETRVYAFISAYVVGGLEGHYYPDLYGPHGIDVDGTVKAIEANRDLVKGIKAHAEIAGAARWGLEVMRLAKEISRQTKLPLYVHLGQLWPMPSKVTHNMPADEVVSGLIEILDAGDVLAHPFTRHPGGFVDQSGRLHPAIREALAKGVLVDVGHGSHFSFKMARKVLEAGVKPYTLGADMHGYNTKLPKPAGTPDKHPDEEHIFAGDTRFSLTRAMTELLTLGFTLEEIVPMVTSHCATLLRLEDEIGTLKPGVVADVSVLSDNAGRWKLADNEGTSVVAERMISPVFCLRAGKRFDADAAILPERQAA